MSVEKQIVLLLIANLLRRETMFIYAMVCFTPGFLKKPQLTRFIQHTKL